MNALSFAEQVKAARAVLAERRRQRQFRDLGTARPHNVIDLAAYRRRVSPLLQIGGSL